MEKQTPATLLNLPPGTQHSTEGDRKVAAWALLFGSFCSEKPCGISHHFTLLEMISSSKHRSLNLKLRDEETWAFFLKPVFLIFLFFFLELTHWSSSPWRKLQVTSFGFLLLEQIFQCNSSLPFIF